MKILITGAKGQLGSQVMHMITSGKSELGEISSQYKSAEVFDVGLEELDITNLNQVQNFVYKLRPDIIINAAAYTNVDACEGNEDIAFKVNALGARNLAIASENVGAKIIHISTDYVFKGDGNMPYREYDITNPVGVYGKTKLAGENFVRELCSRYFIVRTSWLYGYNGNNFVKTILKAGKEKGHLDVVDDQRGNPTNAEDLTHHILKLALSEEYGTYHCTGTGECSWYDFACKIIEYAGIKCTVSATTSNQLTRAAKRPAYSALDNMMLRCTVGDEMRQWKDALKIFIDKIED
ncbi:dTDP-4-dehydrorhamnose reductase [Clostridium sp. CF012]|uniref:dTDP-4-dehydrorhamnose reductase n=1 Tax=Clostridium sp. CF012 TaxID=2843319 RepID=UPI001C0E6452|nr:dTDP-4-dehydrorhamnose reductase [Clostridium sp. CF012]MBU3143477.1 dTDP-4-dehydrorhamnose reductase [Clostridium sp. CF012]